VEHVEMVFVILMKIIGVAPLTVHVEMVIVIMVKHMTAVLLIALVVTVSVKVG
jgi:hypothetical protein